MQQRFLCPQQILKRDHHDQSLQHVSGYMPRLGFKLPIPAPVPPRPLLVFLLNPGAASSGKNDSNRGDKIWTGVSADRFWLP